MNNPKILMFAPYGLWNVHHQVDAVLGAALRQRGAQVWAVGCDGIFERCPIGGSPSDENRCKACIRGARQIFEPFGVPVVWVGSVLRTE
ncbi:MAG TPA: hypothetical protein VLT88_00900, partial [Desulfosarcina sp.]|nr:hypothetical protein [Desulfosarcina sp.]